MELSGLNSKYLTYKNALKGKSYPLAYVDLDLLDENIRQILKRSGKKNIRIASKSVRCTHILEYILQSNQQFQGIMSFSGAETVFLSKKGFDNLLIAYPEVNASILDNICSEIKSGKYINLMVDRTEHLRLVNEMAVKHEITIPVCIDIDMSVDFPGLHFGVWRSSIQSLESLSKFLDNLKQFNSIQLDGVMGYEAQIAGVTDNVRGKWLMNKVIRSLKNNSLSKIAQRRKAAVKMILDKGYQLKIINGGGTGSLESTTEEDFINEVTVGSGFYNSHLFDNYKNFHHQPAAGFACVINRHPKDNIFTCAGGGYIASGSAEPLKLPVPYLPNGIELIKNEGAGEVQTPVLHTGSEPLKIGDPVFFRHSKAGELCERFKELNLIRDKQIEKNVPTYRGEGQCFL
jgi:D-serine deaminase-like pyridoxal phosphate-dependent protein